MENITINNLPTEIQLRILAFVDIQSFLTVRQVSKHIPTSSAERFFESKLNSDMQEYVSNYTRKSIVVVAV